MTLEVAQLEGDAGDWRPPAAGPVYVCPGGLVPPDECTCGHVGRWDWRTWQDGGRGGVDERCPACGDIERYAYRAGRGLELVATVSHGGQPPLL